MEPVGFPERFQQTEGTVKKTKQSICGGIVLKPSIVSKRKKVRKYKDFPDFFAFWKACFGIFFRINLSQRKRNQGTSMVSRSLRAMLSLDAKGWFLAPLPEGRMRFTKTGGLLASPPVKNMLLAVIPAFSLLKCFFHSPFLCGRRLNAQAAGRPVFFRALHTCGRARI